MRVYWEHLLRVSQALALGLAKSLELPDDDFFVQKMQDPVAQMLCVKCVYGWNMRPAVYAGCC